MKIIVDAMGGDNAPMEIVKGAVRAVQELNTEIMLVGQTEAILRCVQELGMRVKGKRNKNAELSRRALEILRSLTGQTGETEI